MTAPSYLPKNDTPDRMEPVQEFDLQLVQVEARVGTPVLTVIDIPVEIPPYVPPHERQGGWKGAAEQAIGSVHSALRDEIESQVEEALHAGIWCAAHNISSHLIPNSYDAVREAVDGSLIEAGEEAITFLLTINRSTDTLQLQINDNGVGIPPRIQSSLLRKEIDTTKDEATSLGGKGKSLLGVLDMVERYDGLAIVDSCHHGEGISIIVSREERFLTPHSFVTAGTKVTITLPLSKLRGA